MRTAFVKALIEIASKDPGSTDYGDLGLESWKTLPSVSNQYLNPGVAEQNMAD